MLQTESHALCAHPVPIPSPTQGISIENANAVIIAADKRVMMAITALTVLFLSTYQTLDRYTFQNHVILVNRVEVGNASTEQTRSQGKAVAFDQKAYKNTWNINFETGTYGSRGHRAW